MACNPEKPTGLSAENGSSAVPERIPIHMIPSGVQPILDALVEYESREAYLQHLAQVVAPAIERLNLAWAVYQRDHRGAELDGPAEELRLARLGLAQALMTEWGIPLEEDHYPMLEDGSPDPFYQVRMELRFAVLQYIWRLTNQAEGCTAETFAERIIQLWPDVLRQMFEQDGRILIGPSNLNSEAGVRYHLETGKPVDLPTLLRYPSLIEKFGLD